MTWLHWLWQPVASGCCWLSVPAGRGVGGGVGPVGTCCTRLHSWPCVHCSACSQIIAAVNHPFDPRLCLLSPPSRFVDCVFAGLHLAPVNENKMGISQNELESFFLVRWRVQVVVIFKFLCFSCYINVIYSFFIVEAFLWTPSIFFFFFTFLNLHY